MQTHDEQFMAVAIACAARGRGAVEPNPMVGAVLVRDGMELARGWHRRFGGPHAEIECFAAARAAGVETGGTTLYVTLEPCCHFGKTPPCTDAIIAAGVGRVVVAMVDPDAKVAGKGLDQLRRAGIAVNIGVGEAAARKLLGPYIKLRTQRRPWVICKWAQTADGYLAQPKGAGRWISNDLSRASVYELRGLCDGILVGIGTVLADDPLLTNRSGRGKQPARVALDAKLRLPETCQLARTVQAGPVIVVTSAQAISAEHPKAQALRRAGVELLPLPVASGKLDLPTLLDDLGARQWTHLLVEGGPAVLESFISAGLADELQVYLSPRAAAQPAAGLPRFDLADLSRRMTLPAAEEQQFGTDVMRRFVLR